MDAGVEVGTRVEWELEVAADMHGLEPQWPGL
jgi:hypothetical protein